MPITAGVIAMKNNIFILFQSSDLGQIGRMNGTLGKVSKEVLLEYFTQNGGISALSALFGAGVAS